MLLRRVILIAGNLPASCVASKQAAESEAPRSEEFPEFANELFPSFSFAATTFGIIIVIRVAVIRATVVAASVISAAIVVAIVVAAAVVSAAIVVVIIDRAIVAEIVEAFIDKQRFVAAVAFQLIKFTVIRNKHIRVQR